MLCDVPHKQRRSADVRAFAASCCNCRADGSESLVPTTSRTCVQPPFVCVAIHERSHLPLRATACAHIPQAAEQEAELLEGLARMQNESAAEPPDDAHTAAAAAAATASASANAPLPSPQASGEAGGGGSSGGDSSGGGDAAAAQQSMDGSIAGTEVEGGVAAATPEAAARWRARGRRPAS
jgi:hypothetical protein